MSDSGSVKDFSLPLDQPVAQLECRTAFENLSDKEKAYAHHLSRASWYGGLIVLVQTSIESGSLFSILHQVFRSESVEELKQRAISRCGFTEEDFSALLVYVSGIYSYMGNYKSMGDSKIVPNLPVEKLDSLLLESKAIKSDASLSETWSRIKSLVYDLSHRKCHLGLGEKGTTTYFSDNCSSEDAAIASRFLESIKMDAYNTRLFKTVVDGVTCYEIRLASIETGSLAGVTRDPEMFENCQFSVTRGDYSCLLRLVVNELELAKKYAANETEVAMLQDYIKSFTTGSLADHKNGSRHWVKNVGPVIETYIGFIENYRDPAGMRGEFESFVAIVNRVMSAKFGALVSAAESILAKLPWPPTLEKDRFLKPDFTSLDVLTFSGSGIPAGINIPNYGEIRQDEGFKNVSLGNVLSTVFKDSTGLCFLSETDKDLLVKHNLSSFEVQVGLHELLGHGSGKLLRKKADGSYNFDVESVKASLGGEVLSWYEEGETYDSKFSSMSNAYEECKAECVGLYLSVDPDVLKIFGHEGEEIHDIIYVNWLSMMYGALKGLEMYNPKTETWMQAHLQARYVIMQVLLEAGHDLIKVTKTTRDDGKDDLLLSFDRSKITTVGVEAIGKFLRKLQVYKSTGNFNAAREMFERYSAVPSSGPMPFAEWRSIVVENKKPRKMFVQSNTRFNGEKVELVEYEATHPGMIQSWKERFEHDSFIYQSLDELWTKDRPYFC